MKYLIFLLTLSLSNCFLESIEEVNEYSQKKNINFPDRTRLIVLSFQSRCLGEKTKDESGKEVCDKESSDFYPVELDSKSRSLYLAIEDYFGISKPRLDIKDPGNFFTLEKRKNGLIYLPFQSDEEYSEFLKYESNFQNLILLREFQVWDSSNLFMSSRNVSHLLISILTLGIVPWTSHLSIVFKGEYYNSNGTKKIAETSEKYRIMKRIYGIYFIIWGNLLSHWRDSQREIYPPYLLDILEKLN